MRPNELYRSARHSGIISCLSFGPERKGLYPSYFFCHKCDLLEAAILSGSKRAHPNQKKYRCTGGHEDLSHPTTLKKRYRDDHNWSSTTSAINDSSFTTTSTSGGCASTNHECSGGVQVSSPTKSPLKKKIRKTAPQLRQRHCLQSSSADDSSSCERSVSSADDDNSSKEQEMIGRRLFHRLSIGNHNSLESGSQRDQPAQQGACDGGAIQERDINDGKEDHDEDDTSFVGDDLMVYIKDLEKQNLFLRTHLISVKEDFNNRIATLEAEVASLRMTDSVGEEVNTTTQHAGSSTPPAGADIAPTCDGMAAIPTTTGMTRTPLLARRTEGFLETSTSRRQRVDGENAEVSRVLSDLINNFVANSDLTADKNRFKKPRLAKIMVDSILSFGWTHRQIQETALMLNMSSPTTTTTADDDGQHASQERDTMLRESLSTLLNNKLRYYRKKSKAAILVDCIWNDAFLDGEVQSSMIERVRQHVRSTVFTPSKILKAMDLAGFNLSLAGVEVLRHVETGDKKYCRGFLPSKSSIIRAARKVECNADQLCPFKMIGRTFDSNATGDFGEGIQFEVVKTLRTLLVSHGLLTQAKERSVELALTSDGAQLTHTISHIMAGVKLHDVGLCDPFTQHPMLLHSPYDCLVQSRNRCFPLRVTLEKDSKTSMYGYNPLYGMFNSNFVSDALQCLPFTMSYTGDMKAQWLLLDSGGAAKVKAQFCYICPCHSDFIHIPQDKSKCQICLTRQQVHDDSGDVELKCYHYEFVSSPEVRDRLQEELNVVTALVQAEGGDENGQHQSSSKDQMYVRLPGQPVIQDDMLDIDFNPQTASATATFSAKVTDALARRSMDVTGPLHVRRNRLREQILRENRIRHLQGMLKHGEPKDKAMYLVMQAVVCILHLENRVGLKSTESILRSGLSNAIAGKLAWIESNAKRRRQDDYISCVTNIIQTKILGTDEAPSQWRFPLAEDGTMGTLSMDNNRTRSVMNEIELIIQVSFPDSDSKDKLLKCFPHYRAALTILRKTTDYRDDEIEQFQEHIDAWFCDWVEVYGREGCTNYTHLLSSSHVMHYMKEWRCLYRYSQQGWEALNAQVKAYFFRRTNRGGLSRNAEKKSKLLGIGRWLQRRIMWFSGHGDALFVDDGDVLDENNETDDDGGIDWSESFDGDDGGYYDFSEEEDEDEHE
jgi:hypothetical protein